jgi:hypothetical protein
MTHHPSTNPLAATGPRVKTDAEKWAELREWAKLRRIELHLSDELRNPAAAPILIGKWGGFDEVVKRMDRLDAERKS